MFVDGSTIYQTYQPTMEPTMTIYVLQYRRSGDDNNVQVFTTRQEAQEVAFSFLLHVSDIFCDDSDYTESMYEAVAEHCYDNDIAYIEITTHNLPQE